MQRSQIDVCCGGQRLQVFFPTQSPLVSHGFGFEPGKPIKFGTAVPVLFPHLGLE
jgi:hypothetical protein